METPVTNRSPRQFSPFPFIVFFGTLALYWRTGAYQFSLLDDLNYIVNNPHVNSGLSWTNIAWSFRAYYSGNWHPLTWISHMLDCSLFGLSPAGPHLINVFIHALNSLLLFIWLRRVTRLTDASAVVTAWFAWHPSHVESVAWVAERKDLLSTLFFLLTLMAYTAYNHRRSRWRYALTLVLFALGLMSKPMLVTLPFVLLLLDYWPLNRFAELRQTLGSPLKAWSRLAFEKIPFFLLTFAACIVTVFAQRSDNAIRTLTESSLSHRLAMCVVAYGKYLWKLCWPVNLCMYYPMPAQVPVIAALLAALTIALVLFLAWRFRLSCPWLAIGMAWFFGTLVPVIGLLQVGGQEMADRYTYIPSIGFFIAVVWSARAILNRYHLPIVKFVLGYASILACVLITNHQLPTWRDSLAMFERAAAVSQNNYLAETEVGTLIANTGDYTNGLVHLTRALAINPRYQPAQVGLGLLYETLGDYLNAVSHLKSALEPVPTSDLLRTDLGRVYLKMNRLTNAIAEFHTALVSNPANSQAWFYQGLAWQKLGVADQALAAFAQAQTYDYTSLEIADHRAYLMAACTDPKIQNPLKSLSLSREVVKQTGSNVAPYLATLALASAVNSDFSNAITAAERAQSLAHTYHLSNLVLVLDGDLQAYRLHKTPTVDWKSQSSFAP